MFSNLKNSMFSLFSSYKQNKALEEEKIEQPLEASKHQIGIDLPQNNLLFDRIKKSDITKQILLKRRRDTENSAEFVESSYKKRLISKRNRYFYLV